MKISNRITGLNNSIITQIQELVDKFNSLLGTTKQIYGELKIGVYMVSWMKYRVQNRWKNRDNDIWQMLNIVKGFKYMKL